METTPEKKALDRTPGVCKKARERLGEHEAKKICDQMRRKLNSLAWMQSATSGRNQAQLNTHITPSLPWSMVVAASYCGDAFQLQGLGDLKGKREQWMEPNTGKSLSRTCFRVQKTLECGEDLHFNWIMTPIIQPKKHWNGFRTRTWKSLSGPVKAQTWISLRICGKTWRLLFTDASHRTWQSFSKSERKNGRKSPNPDVQSWYRHTHEDSKCNHCQRYFYKVLIQGVEYLLTQDISAFHFQICKNF